MQNCLLNISVKIESDLKNISLRTEFNKMPHAYQRYRKLGDQV